jgi:hypothetical protein
LHFHGIFQQGTPEMDGPAHATQCPVPPGHSFTYSFTVRHHAPRLKEMEELTFFNRFLCRALTGIIRTLAVNIQMAYAAHSSFMIHMTLMRTNMTRNSC